MSPSGVIQTAMGAVDGLNQDFRVTVMYAPNSTGVFINGQAKCRTWDDGWDELGNNKVRLKQAPQLGDVVQIYFRPI